MLHVCFFSPRPSEMQESGTVLGNGWDAFIVEKGLQRGVLK